MNQRTQYRIEQVSICSRKLRRQRDARRVQELTAACFLLVVGLGVSFGNLTRGLSLGRPGMAGFAAVLLWGDADAYVLVGVVTFTAGAVVTGLCLRSQRKRRQRIKQKIQTKSKKN